MSRKICSKFEFLDFVRRFMSLLSSTFYVLPLFFIPTRYIIFGTNQFSAPASVHEADVLCIAHKLRPEAIRKRRRGTKTNARKSKLLGHHVQQPVRKTPKSCGGLIRLNRKLSQRKSNEFRPIRMERSPSIPNPSQGEKSLPWRVRVRDDQ